MGAGGGVSQDGEGGGVSLSINYKVDFSRGLHLMPHTTFIITSFFHALIFCGKSQNPINAICEWYGITIICGYINNPDCSVRLLQRAQTMSLLF